MISLLDVNFLIALVWKKHLHHRAAGNWFSQHAHRGWATCLLTQSAFLRLSLMPHVVGAKTNCNDARDALIQRTSDPNHHFIEQCPTLSNPPFDDMIPNIVGHKQLPDATLLHLARFHSMKLVTFDQAVSSICPWPAHLDVISP